MKKYLSFLSEIFQFLEIKFSIYLNRRVFEIQAFFFFVKANSVPVIVSCAISVYLFSAEPDRHTWTSIVPVALA